MTLCLKPDELRDLTDTPQVALQLEWLDRHKWPYELSRLGRPKVARAYFDRRMGVAVAANDASAQTEPDWSQSA